MTVRAGSPVTLPNGAAPAAEAGTGQLSSSASGECVWTDSAGNDVPLTNGGAPIGGSAGAAGAVQFSDGAAGFAADDAELFWDDTNKRLGIGTPTPAFDVELQKNVNAATVFRMENENPGSSAAASFSTKAENALLSAVAWSSTASGTTAGVSRNDLVTLQAGSAARFMIGTGGAFPIDFYTNGAIRATVPSAGGFQVALGIAAFGVTPPGVQPGAITNVPTGGSADAAANATAINSILAALRGNGTIAT